jgi:hypothetical protein
MFGALFALFLLGICAAAADGDRGMERMRDR